MLPLIRALLIWLVKAAISQWICLRLPSCGTARVRIPSTTSMLPFIFSQILCYICLCFGKKAKINKKRPGLARLKTYLGTVFALSRRLSQDELVKIILA